MQNPARRSRRRWGMPRTDPVPTAPAPPIWKTLLALMPATGAWRSARRRCWGRWVGAGPDGPRTAARTRPATARPDARRVPTAHRRWDRTLTDEPGREGEGEVQPTHKPSAQARRRSTRSSTTSARSRPSPRLISSPVARVSQPDVGGGAAGSTGPVDGDDIHRPAQPPARACRFGDGVPVPGRAGHPQVALQVGPGQFGGGIAVRRVHIDLAADDGQFVAPTGRRAERLQAILGRCGGQKRDVVP